MLVVKRKSNPVLRQIPMVPMGAGTNKLNVAQVARMINIASMTEALQKVEEALLTSTGFLFFTLNLDHLTKLNRFESFRKLYELATFVSADGWPVAYIARRKGGTMQRTTGADLVLPICELAARIDIPIYLFGSTTKVLTAAAATLSSCYPGLRIVGKKAPAQAFDPNSKNAHGFARDIAKSGAKLCFVALGAPTQEAFSALSRQYCPTVGFVCVGAALDFMAGTQHRAPVILQKARLEWAWRWSLSPRRLTRRYLQCVPVFAGLLATKWLTVWPWKVFIGTGSKEMPFP